MRALHLGWAGLALHLAATSAVAAPVDRPPISGAAFRAADAAYRAYADRRYRRAAQAAARSVRLRPDIPRLRLLLVRALRADGRLEEALDAARQAQADGVAGADIAQEAAEIVPARQVTPSPSIPSIQASGGAGGFMEAQAAYAARAQGDSSQAVGKAAAAVRISPSDLAYRTLLIDSLTDAGRLAEAEVAAEDAVRTLGSSPAVQGRRGFLLLRLQRPAEAVPAFEAAVADAADAGARRRLALGLSDARLQSQEPERALSALAILAGERSYDVASRRAQALIALQRKPEALNAVRVARLTAPNARARALQTLAELYILSDLDRKTELRQLLRKAASQPGFGAGSELEIAELAVRSHDDVDALIFFHRARAAGPLTSKTALDAAYAAKHQGRNALAVELFGAALQRDADVDHVFSRDYRDRLGRETAEIAKTWGVNATILAGAVNFPSAVNGALPASDQRVTQAGGEVYWRPPVIGYRDGRTVELFARGFVTLEDQSGGATGRDSVQGYFGARWKPFSAENLVLETSRLVKLGSASRNDWLLRAAYSRDYGIDLGDPRPQRPTWRVYGELDRLTESAQTLAFGEARAGWLFRLDRVSDRLTLSPVVDATYSYDNQANADSAFGLGPAVVMRYWFGRGPAHAANSYLELTAGERVRVFGGRRADGPFASLALVY